MRHRNNLVNPNMVEVTMTLVVMHDQLRSLNAGRKKPSEFSVIPMHPLLFSFLSESCYNYYFPYLQVTLCSLYHCAPVTIDEDLVLNL